MHAWREMGCVVSRWLGGVRFQRREREGRREKEYDYVTSDGLARGCTSELAAVSNRVL